MEEREKKGQIDDVGARFSTATTAPLALASVPRSSGEGMQRRRWTRSARTLLRLTERERERKAERRDDGRSLTRTVDEIRKQSFISCSSILASLSLPPSLSLSPAGLSPCDQRLRNPYACAHSVISLRLSLSLAPSSWSSCTRILLHNLLKT